MTRAFVKLAEATAPSGAVAGHTDFASARVARLTSRMMPPLQNGLAC